MSSISEGVQFGLAVGGIFLLTGVVEYMRHTRNPKDGRERMANAASCFVFLLLTSAGYIHQPEDKADQPSILLTAAAGMQLFAFLLLWFAPSKVARAPPEFGMVLVYSLAARTWCTMQYNGYLPVDNTGDGCIQILEGLAGLAALVGVAVSGPSGKALSRAGTVVLAALAGASVCYGVLDRSLFADRLYASTIYAEVMAWWFVLQHSRAAARRREPQDGIYLLPSFVQAICRLYFWYAAYPEILPDPGQAVRLMAAFPAVIVSVHVVMAFIIAVVGCSAVDVPVLELDIV